MTSRKEQNVAFDDRGLCVTCSLNIGERRSVLVADPCAGTNSSGLIQWNGDFDDRGLECIAYDMNMYLSRLGRSAAAHSFAALQAFVPEDPFGPDGILEAHVRTMPILRQSLEDATAVPDLGTFLPVRQQYSKTFNAVMARHDLAALNFPQSAAALPGVFETAPYPATTVSGINIAGLPGVTVPAGQLSNTSPFSLIFVGRMWDEAKLLGLAYDYEQATHHRIVPSLVKNGSIWRP